MVSYATVRSHYVPPFGSKSHRLVAYRQAKKIQLFRGSSSYQVYTKTHLLRQFKVRASLNPLKTRLNPF